jgi:hypothetical protein
MSSHRMVPLEWLIFLSKLKSKSFFCPIGSGKVIRTIRSVLRTTLRPFCTTLCTLYALMRQISRIFLLAFVLLSAHFLQSYRELCNSCVNESRGIESQLSMTGISKAVSLSPFTIETQFITPPLSQNIKSFIAIIYIEALVS